MSSFKIGDRVRVITFGPDYDGLTGELAQVDFEDGFHLVILDEDPCPSIRAAGLQVLDHEIEKIDG